MASVEYKQLSSMSRRGFLVAITGSALAAAAGCRPNGIVAPTPYVPGSGAGASGGTAAASGGTAPAPAGTAAAATGIDPNYGMITFDKQMFTTTDKLYDTQWDYNNTPAVDAAQWSLTVDGLVENPITLDYAAVKAFPAFEDTRTLECISNPVGGELIGNIAWKGFKMEEILNQVKLKPTAKFAKFAAADGYQTSVALDWITQPGVMMAYEMNGAPLSTLHGFPLRILMPGLYGQKMPRWITHIEFIDSYFQGYWESNGWSDVASVQTESTIDTPKDGYTAKVGNLLYIQGTAFAGKRQITKVEVQIEGGGWVPVTLVPGASPLTWTQWYLPWTPAAPGLAYIEVRATDDAGFTQSQQSGGVFGGSGADGTNAIHQIGVHVE
jgi:DMSO/TMAO reductase YedYZ molybdopterin-dependent catalytic subunit